MTEAEWLACARPMELLVYLEANAKPSRLTRTAGWLRRRAGWSTARPRPCTPRLLYLLACGVDRLWWRALGHEELTPGQLMEEHFAEGELTLAELLAANPERQWHWPYPWHLVSNRFRRGIGRPQFEPTRRPCCDITRDIFGNPFRSVTFSLTWRTDTVLTLAQQMYALREFGAMPILADALQDAGCDNDDVLSHCRSEGAHVRGCWVVDLVLGKE